MLPSGKLVILACLVAATAAYYGDNDYGQDPSYAYEDYGDSYGSPASYDYDGGYEDDGGYEEDDEPVYGGNQGLNYGTADAYNSISSGRSSGRPSRRRAVSPAAGYGRRRSAGRRQPAYRQSRYEDEGYGSYDDYDNYEDEEYDYAPKRRYGGRQRGSRMDRYGRSGTYGYAKPQKHVPVIIKKKKEKKRKIISVHNGFYIPGGTAIFGKFKDLKSCEKACELTPTCFSGDFNPWLNKCYIHSNLTACQSMKAHKQITHFKKVPCNIVETPRGLITLGAASWNGLQQKNVKNLMDCIKKCATAGGGVAPTPETAADTPQLCFGIDYDFADHTCYFHTLIAICGGNADANATPLTPVSLYPNPSSINILICPLTT